MKYIYYGYVLLIFILLLFIVYKIGKFYWRHFLNYLFCVKISRWKKEIERPRLFFVLIGIICMINVSYFLSRVSLSENFSFVYFFISILSLLTALFFFIYPWSQKFEKIFVVNVRKKLEDKMKVKFIMFDFENKEELYNRFSNYLQGPKETFNLFTEYDGTGAPINVHEKLIWIDNRKNTRNNNGNKQTLICFIMIVFNTIEPYMIENIANTFFYFEKPISSRNISGLNSNRNSYIRDFNKEITEIIEKLNIAVSQ